MALLPLEGWVRGHSYRVTLTADLADTAGRPLAQARDLPLVIPAEGAVTAAPPPDLAVTYDSVTAASSDLGGRFPGGQTMLFQGLWTDPTTGLAYARNRWYDPHNAAWLSEDPMGPADSSNLYAFVGWGPTSATDPTGKATPTGSDVADVIDNAMVERGLMAAAYCRQGPQAAACRSFFINQWATLGPVAMTPVTMPLRLGSAEGKVYSRIEGTLQGHQASPVRNYAELQRQANEATGEMAQVLGDVFLVYGVVEGGAGFGSRLGGGTSSLGVLKASAEHPRLPAGGPTAVQSNPGQYTTTIRWGIREVEARPFGPGYWGQRTAQLDPRVEAFELKINPNNESFYLPHPNGGFVQFENFTGLVVQDGKLVVQSSSIYHIEDLPPFAQAKALAEATRQVEAAHAAGLEVEWLVSDPKAIQQMGSVFRARGVPVTLTHLPE